MPNLSLHAGSTVCCTIPLAYSDSSDKIPGIGRTYSHKQVVAAEVVQQYKVNKDSQVGEGQVLGDSLKAGRHSSSINDWKRNTPALALASWDFRDEYA